MVYNRTHHTRHRLQSFMEMLPGLFRFVIFSVAAWSLSKHCPCSRDRHKPAFQTMHLTQLILSFSNVRKPLFQTTSQPPVTARCENNPFFLLAGRRRTLVFRHHFLKHYCPQRTALHIERLQIMNSAFCCYYLRNRYHIFPFSL